MASNSMFYKFPKTPHLEGSAVVDDDKSVGWKTVDKMASVASKDGQVRYVVQEKVDGANVGLHYEEEWSPIVQKRSGIVGSEKHQQYHVYRDWVWEHSEALFAILSTRFCLYGEWMWCEHAVSYNALDTFFIAFDVYDKETSTFLSLPRVVALLQPAVDAGIISLVPVLADEVVVGGTKLQGLISGLDTLTSHFGSDDAEGVYVRLENSNRVIDRWKLRRDTFTAGRTDFATNVKKNSLKTEGTEQA